MLNTITLFCQRRLWIVLALGFASGLPLGLSGATLQAWYTQAGLDIRLIGMLTLVGQPYLFKFMWAPVLDKVRLPWLSFRRDWLLFTQLCLAGLLCWMAFSNPTAHPAGLAFLALVLALFSATQDIAIDAYRTEILKPEERGLGSAFYVGGYRVAMLVSGGLAFIAADYLGFERVYQGMAVLMGVGVLATLFAPDVAKSHHKKQLRWRDVIIKPWLDWFSRPQAWIILLFIVFYKLGDAMANSLTTPFLLNDISLTLAQIGWLNKVLGIIATLLGAFMGGLILSKMPLLRALMIFGILQGASTLCYFALAIMPMPGMLEVGAALFIEHLCSGMGTSAFVAFLMSVCNPQFAATQFALLTALSAVGRVLSGPIAGYMVANQGWPTFFLVSTLCAIPGLWLLRRISLAFTRKIT